MKTSDTAARAAQVLSRPVTLGGLTVPNRIAMAPMTREFSPGGVPGPDVADYYARRAAGGAGHHHRGHLCRSRGRRDQRRRAPFPR